MNTNKLLAAVVLAGAIGAPIGFIGDTKGQSMTSSGVFRFFTDFRSARLPVRPSWLLSIARTNG
jgi:hypothetical protein